ncbi:MAG: hypothetical protein KIS68_11350 [Bauldia sp.]|nr:hypothetical protein [Bauldia sp.]
MNNPDEFNAFCQMFDQDAPSVYPTPQEMAAAAVGSLDAAQRVVALRFVDQVLATGRASDAKRVLRKSPT